jgi:hypothetical protein
MKLRIKGNSLRLRLTQSEVSLLFSDGKVEESVEFGTGPSSLVYRVETIDNAQDVSASFENGRLNVFIPKRLAPEWAATEKVSIERADTVPSILIEKDFACLTPRPSEDESDMFPNPAKATC